MSISALVDDDNDADLCGLNPWAALIQDSLDDVIDAHRSKWELLKELADEATGDTTAQFSASCFSTEAREQAAKKLISNHLAVLKDITNASPSTQKELVRVPRSEGVYVDLFLLEVARRLLGKRPDDVDAAAADKYIEVRLDRVNEKMNKAWKTAAQYLNGRTQALPEQKKGRNPDMSFEAAQAFLSVCNEVGEPNPKWFALRGMINAGSADDDTITYGIAARHPREVRMEAARKLVNNHQNVLIDITNPAPETQHELKRVPMQYRPYVDAFLREMCRRLYGHRAGPEADILFKITEETLEPSEKDKLAIWGAAAKYLKGRVQSNPDQKPGRTPDMSPTVASAFLEVAEEIGMGRPLEVQQEKSC